MPGLTLLIGSVAHLGYSADEFVVRCRWLTEHSYADLGGAVPVLLGPPAARWVWRWGHAWWLGWCAGSLGRVYAAVGLAPALAHS